MKFLCMRIIFVSLMFLISVTSVFSGESGEGIYDYKANITLNACGSLPQSLKPELSLFTRNESISSRDYKAIFNLDSQAFVYGFSPACRKISDQVCILSDPFSRSGTNPRVSMQLPTLTIFENNNIFASGITFPPYVRLSTCSVDIDRANLSNVAVSLLGAWSGTCKFEFEKRVGAQRQMITFDNSIGRTDRGDYVLNLLQASEKLKKLIPTSASVSYGNGKIVCTQGKTTTTSDGLRVNVK